MKNTKKPKETNTFVRRETFSALILQKIGELGVAAVDGFFPRKYPEARLWRKFLGLESSYVFSRSNFSKILSKLQNQGLVERTGWHKNSKWKLTMKGQNATKGSLDQASDGITRIVVFDIPEKERKKRYILRAELVAHGYKPLQKSVWLGTAPLTKNFIENLDALHLQKYVHIFSIRELGSIREK